MFITTGQLYVLQLSKSRYTHIMCSNAFSLVWHSYGYMLYLLYSLNILFLRPICMMHFCWIAFVIMHYQLFLIPERSFGILFGLAMLMVT